jgi:hypothetical protein
MRLQNHYVQCQPECPLCPQALEEDWHLLLECEGSKKTSNVMGLEAIITTTTSPFSWYQSFDSWCLLQGK